MKICFLGYCVDTTKHQYKSNLSGADNQAQLGYIMALEQNAKDRIYVISDYDCENTSDPNTVECIGKFSLIEYISSVHITCFKKMRKTLRVFKAVILWARKNKNENKTVFVYNTFVKNFGILFIVKLFFKIKIIPIIITLPYTIENNNPIIKLKYQIMDRCMKYSIKKCDGIIGITQYVVNELAPNMCSRVINGGINITKDINKKNSTMLMKDQNIINITYAGALYARYNLKNIIAALNMLPEYNCIFNVFGVGEEEDYFKKIKAINVHYYGFIEKEKLFNILCESDILVALLETGDKLEKYTFPSKILEYLASGAEILCTDVLSINDDLKKHMHIINNVSPESIAAQIKNIIDDRNHKLNTDDAQKTLEKKYSWTEAGRQALSLAEEIWVKEKDYV